MSLQVEVTYAARSPWVPRRGDFTAWAGAAWRAVAAAPSAATRSSGTALEIRVVGRATGRRLNCRYRGKDSPTNVLSFAGCGLAPDGRRHLGELVICAPVMAAEARRRSSASGSPPSALAARRWHWAHITVHGVLHLAGFDHERPAAARKMESLEVQILDRLGFSDPYA
jgi:probable rRNA maturation factor